MTKLTVILSATLLAATAGLAQARDIAPAEATQLLNEAALALHPGGTIDDAELEEKGGRYIYEVEVYDAQGVEWDLDLDAATGEVLKNRKDD